MHTAVMELHNQLLSQAKRCQRSLSGHKGPIPRAFCKVEQVRKAEDGIFSLQRSSLSDQRERDVLLADIDNMISAQQGAFEEFKLYLPQLR